MADQVIEITVKDVSDNLTRIMTAIDALYPGRSEAGETFKDWIQNEVIRKWLISEVRRYEAIAARNQAAQDSEATDEPIIDEGDTS